MARKLVYRCFCGFVAEDEEDELVISLTNHAFDVHQMTVSREQVLAMAVPVTE